jgi:proline dehydrogenase
MTVTDAHPVHTEDATVSAAAEPLAAAALRGLAADARCRAAFGAPDALVRTLLAPAAGRYVVGRDRAELLTRAAVLRELGYRVSVELVGEENAEPAGVEEVVREYLDLLAAGVGPAQLGFDLSNVGLLISPELATANTSRILAAAAEHGCEVVLSMERSSFTDQILDVFHTLAAEHRNVGITVQAHLFRTSEDLPRVLATGAKIRLVKGAYTEPADVAVPRGPELAERYLRLAEQILDVGGRLALATHDATLLDAAEARGILSRAEEVEMLHGVRPRLLRRIRAAGHPCRVYATYGQNWWLHLMHRLAENPALVITALADIADPARVVFGADYQLTER